MLNVKRRMSRDIVQVSPSISLAEAALTMIERKVGSALVTSAGELVGIITERDVMRAVARGLIPWSTTVVDCMTLDPVTTSLDASAGEALRRMTQGGFRHLPVMDDREVVGIVSIRDLVAGMVEIPTPEELDRFEDFEILREPW